MQLNGMQALIVRSSYHRLDEALAGLIAGRLVRFLHFFAARGTYAIGGNLLDHHISVLP